MPVNDERLALREAVADVDRAVIVQADDVARVRLLDVLAVGRHERDRVADADFALQARVIHAHPGLVGARAHAQKTRFGRGARGPCSPES